DGQIRYVTAVRTFTGSKVMRDLTVDDIHTYYVIAGDRPVLVHNNDGDELFGQSCPIYRTPKKVDVDYETKNGPNPKNHQKTADDDGMAYFGEESVAAEYRGVGSYADGMVRYDMHPSFLKEFADTAHRCDWKGPGGKPRIEFAIPVDRLGRFAELTLRRTWLPRRG
ncbi:hypothetical protein AB0C02_33515, partial [Micromonospora sp. NPDC048999]